MGTCPTIDLSLKTTTALLSLTLEGFREQNMQKKH